MRFGPPMLDVEWALGKGEYTGKLLEEPVIF